MADFVVDTFTGGSAGDDLSTHTGETGATWTEHSSYTTGATQLDGTGGVFCQATPTCYYASGTPTGADYSVSGVIVRVDTADCVIGVAGRVQTGANTLYYAHWRKVGATLRWELAKVVAGTFTSLGTYNQTLVVGTEYTVLLTLTGTALELFVDGVSRISLTDGDIAVAGRAGLRATTAVTTTTGVHLNGITASETAGGAAGAMSAMKYWGP